ncbi:hypothetical protein [Streptosporangium sandarakinum]|uniref:Uncharacterized protein n=1 Tax=Streptosporangium sandarakinum TaxID=1260955 RepID=A0A852V5L5_9ACTN|nr:hypothetical protein [Streptosporangium sandarakinum]NYF41611.1 hypothetical protein [Streptosporangium sandarakinum]
MTRTVNRPLSEGKPPSEVIAADRPPEPDRPTMTEEELVAHREAENRWRASSAARTAACDERKALR